MAEKKDNQQIKPVRWYSGPFKWVKSKMPQSFRGQVFLFVIPIVVTMSLVYTLESISTERKILREQIVKRGETIATITAKNAELPILSENYAQLRSSAVSIMSINDVAFVSFLNKRFEILLHEGEKFPLGLPPLVQPQMNIIFTEHPDVFEFFVPVMSAVANEGVFFFEGQDTPRPANEFIGWVRIGISKDVMGKAEIGIIKRGAILAVLFSVAGLLIAYFFMSFLLRPLQTLMNAVRDIGEGGYAEVGGSNEDSEIGRLTSEFNRMSHSIKEREEFLNNILENIPYMIFVKDADELRFVRFNKAGEDLLGYSREEMYGKSSGDLFPDEMADSFVAKDREALLSRQMIDIPEDIVYTRLKGKRILHSKKIPILNAQGNPEYLLGISEDITEHIQAEAERGRLVTAIEQVAEAIIITDVQWNICYVNPSFERMYGYSRDEIDGQPAGILKNDIQDPRTFHIISEALANGEVWSGQLIDFRKDGTHFEAEVTVSPVRDRSGNIINYVSIHRDITHEMRLESQLRQAQKMEAIGTLAGGIAHDFNNILTAIIGFTQMAMFKLPANSPAQYDLQRVLESSCRAADMVKQILTFSRQDEKGWKEVQVIPIISEVLRLMRSTLPTTIEIRQDIKIKPDEDWVNADPTQLHQILMNLSTNAAHAMRKNGGMLKIGLSSVILDDGFVARYPDLNSGLHLRLIISDTGHGMPKEIQERIFDPYFTTKAPGEGTGMGLSVVQGIVKSHGGMITVYSELEKGTTFQIFLPIIPKHADQLCVTEEAAAGGNEHILFVDDEMTLVALGQEMLESLGYKFTGTTSSKKALELFRAAPESFDLVITDMTMPGMTGKELAMTMMDIRPDIPVIICTGFSELIDEKQAMEIGIRELIMKPYVANALAGSIRRVLT